MSELTAEEISKQVMMEIDDELSKQESQIAEQFGAVKIDNIQEKIENADNLSDELARVEVPKEKEEIDISPVIEIPANVPVIDEKIKTKESLIASIHELQTNLGIPLTSEHKLKRKKKAELEELLAGLYNRGSEKLESLQADGRSREEVNSEVIVKNLYLMNMILTGSLEKLSEKVKTQTYDVALLEGMCDRIKAGREDLMEILRRVYAEHKVVLNKIASPAALYLGFMTNAAVFTAFDNLEKKKQKLNEK